MTDVLSDASGELNGRLLRHDCAEIADAANHPVFELFASSYVTGALITHKGCWAVSGNELHLLHIMSGCIPG